jgi:two-component system nitrogen regulation sensor histidine kinase GlnL
MKLTNNEQNLLDALQTAIVVLDEGMNILFVNAGAENVLGLSNSHVKGQRLSDCFEELNGTVASIQAAIHERKNITQREAHWVLNQGQRVVVDFSVAGNESKDYVLLEINPKDRLLKISREEAWLASHETTSHMVRSMAHEIKNPLGGILGAAQLLDREIEDQKELREYINVIIEETDRLRSLTDRMLGPTKPVEHSTLNIHQVLERVMSVIAIENDGRINIRRDYDPSIPDLTGDAEQLIQAFLNIARNALQALTENHIDCGEIIFRTRIRNRYTIAKQTNKLVVECAIIDNGPGIPNAILENIFYPMITGRAKGTGLGLAISQKLVARHNGIIECESKPGHTAFTTYLPLETRNEQSQ